MKKDAYEGNISVHDTQHEKEREGDFYAQYQELGGIINRKDYEGAFRKAKETITVGNATM